MPLRGAHIRHGLNDVIFCHQMLAEPVGKLAHLMVTPDKGLLVGSLTETVEDSRAMNTVIDGQHSSPLPLVFTSTPNNSTPSIRLGRLSLTPATSIEVVPWGAE